MTRTTDPALIAGFAAPTVAPFMAAFLDYPAGPVRLTSLPHGSVVMIDGQPWYGAGALGEISKLEDGGESRSYGFTLTLAAIPGDWGAYLRAQDVQGRAVCVYLGLVDAAWQVSAVQVVKVGRMDVQDVQVSAETTAVVVSCEDIMVDWERPRVRRCTDVDHRSRYPTDGAFKYVAALQNAILKEPV